MEQEVPNEFLLVIDDGDEGVKSEVDTKPLERRPKGVYYKNIERKMLLKKKRINVRFPSLPPLHAVTYKPGGFLVVRTRCTKVACHQSATRRNERRRATRAHRNTRRGRRP